MNTGKYDKFNEDEKKVIELIEKGYNEDKISKELNLDLEIVRRVTEEYATIAYDLETTNSKVIEPEPYTPNAWDYIEGHGVQNCGGEYFKDGVYAGEDDGLPAHDQDFMSVYEKKLEGLTPDQQEVYNLSTGYFDGQPKTISEVAKELGRTEEEIENILREAREILEKS